MSQSDSPQSRLRDRPQELIGNLKQTQNFLTQKILAEPVYRELRDTLGSLVHRLEVTNKPVVKIVSPSSRLATGLQQRHKANEELRSLYEFEAISPITQIRQIVQHCAVICLIYDSHHQIQEHHQKLLELACQQDISLFLLVHKSSSKIDGDWTTSILGDRYSDWINRQAKRLNDWVKLPLDDFIDFQNQQQMDVYGRSLIEVFSAVEASFWKRCQTETARVIQQFFHREIADTWREIKHLRNKYLAGQQPHIAQQQLRQSINNSSQARRQKIQDIKQDINHFKADLLNPFMVNSLIFNLQQLIDSAQIKVVKEVNETYLYLILDSFPEQPLINDYILEFCQQKTREILEEQWSKINYVYGSGGLKQLVTEINQELEIISPLLDNQDEQFDQRSPAGTFVLRRCTGDLYNLKLGEKQPRLELDLRQTIEPYCLKVNSRIVFDYSYTQSSWFRLLISALVGVVIYLITWIFFGEGKYLGFMIVIFQIINLITGQNIKQAKLKQQSKELKRLVDQRYQTLVRTIIHQLTQTLIAELDHQSHVYQEAWLEAIATAQNKLEELKQVSDQHKLRVESLQQDRDQIQSWFN
jgi:hypothetical protein